MRLVRSIFDFCPESGQFLPRMAFGWIGIDGMRLARQIFSFCPDQLAPIPHAFATNPSFQALNLESAPDFPDTKKSEM